MAGYSDYAVANQQNYIFRQTAMPATPTAYVALFTTAPTSNAGTGGTEVSGGSYARKSTVLADWNTPAASSGTEPGTTPGYISNANTLSFPAATALWGVLVAWGIYDAVSGGNLQLFDWLGNYSWLPATMSAVGSGSGGVVTSPAHGYANGDTVVVTTKYGGALPTLTQGSFAATLLVANATTDTFTLTTSGAVALWSSTTGDFQIRKVATQRVDIGVTASFAGGAPGALVSTGA